MHKLRNILAVVTAIVMIILKSNTCMAATYYVNPENGYTVTVSDDSNLLRETGNTEEELAEFMQEITEYGNVAFISTSIVPNGGTDYFVENLYYRMYGSNSGIIFLVDMNNRQLRLWTNGAIGKVITVGYANSIMDNVYTYAKKGNYYECAIRTFSQILSLLSGGHIAQPMKIANNVLLALVIAFIINFIIVSIMTKRRKASNSEVLRDLLYECHINNPREIFTYQTKVYDPPSSSSGSHGGGHGGGGHGGGGHGGGHGF